jgi:predicted RNA-binding protein with PUA-like domain
MASFLFKTEPSDVSFQALVKKKRVTWDGVTNAAALIHLRSIAKGDTIYIYHTGDEKAVVGIARALGGAFEDPKKPGRTPDGKPKFAVVDLAPVGPVKTPVTLAEIKSDPRFAEFALVRQSRLSVMPVPGAIEKALRSLASLPE